MISKSTHVYGQKTFHIGEFFEAEPDHIKMLTVTGRAEVSPSEIHTREITTEGRATLTGDKFKHDGKKEK